MTPWDVVPAMLQLFPEVREMFAQEESNHLADDWSVARTGPYLLYGLIESVLVRKCVIPAVLADPHRSSAVSLLARLDKFAGEMLASESLHVRDVASQSICEALAVGGLLDDESVDRALSGLALKECRRLRSVMGNR